MENTLQVCKIPCPGVCVGDPRSPTLFGHQVVLLAVLHLQFNQQGAGGRVRSPSPSQHCQTCTEFESPSCHSCFQRACPLPERCSKLQWLKGFKLLSLLHTKYYTQEKILFEFWAQVGSDIYWDHLKTEKPTNKTANSNMPAFVQVEWWQSPVYAHFMICCSQRSQEYMWRADVNHLRISDPAKLYICKSKQLRDCWDCYPS